MSQLLDYSIAPSGTRTRPGLGYFAILIAGIVGLSLTIYLFIVEISGDAYAPLFGLLYGAPITAAQFLIVAMPAMGYASRRHSVGRGWLWALLAIPVLSILLGAVGVALAVTLPRTHGSGC